MIRIVKGTFGYFDGRRVVPVTAADGPQSYDPELEARLVSEGVAEYVGGATCSVGEADHRVTVTPHVDVHVEVEADPEPEADEPALEDMTRAELAELAESYGIRPGKLTKARLIEAIEEAEGAAPDLAAAEVE